MDVNREIEDLRELIGGYGIDDDHGQARAFALALALSERGLFSLRDFQAALIGRIISFEKSQCIAGTADKYTRWIEALEDLLRQKGMLSGDRLSLLERDVVEDAASRKVHQRMTSRNENGHLDTPIIKIGPAREIIGNAAEQHGTSAALDSGNPIGRKLKASHLADESVAAIEPGGIAHRCFKTSFVENTQFGRAIEAVDLQALSFA